MMKKRKTAVLFLVFPLLILLLCPLLPIHGEDAIYDTVIRLHVVANSDSDEDQALKLTVRDALLSSVSDALSECQTREAAVALLESQLPILQKVAEKTIAAEGYTHQVHLVFGEEDYPQKDYDSFCFPAGRYLSLQVLIGGGEGRNWWCVLFPPLCTAAATASRQEAEDAFLSVGLTPEQYKVITESDETKYKLRFRLLEWLESLKN